jgi:hypothetical protein
MGDIIYDHNANSTVDKIYYDVSNTGNIFTVELNIYNPVADATLQKFWLKIDKAKLQKKTKSQIRLAIFNKDINLIRFMESLDAKINEVAGTINTNIESFSTSLELSDTYAPMINLDIDDETRVFNDNNELVNLYTIANGSHVSILIELESVKIYGTHEYKAWRVKQMKENKLINLDVSLFNNKNNMIPSYATPSYATPSYATPSYATPLYAQPNIQSYIPPPPPPPMLQSMKQSTSHPMSHPISQQVLQPVSQPVSQPRQPASQAVARAEPARVTPADLVGALKKLKKIPSKKEDIKPITEAGIAAVDLKKVITKEPVSVVDIMKQEYIDKKNSDFIRYILDTQQLVDMADVPHILKKHKKQLKKDKAKRDKIKKEYKIFIKEFNLLNKQLSV